MQRALIFLAVFSILFGGFAYGDNGQAPGDINREKLSKLGASPVIIERCLEIAGQKKFRVVAGSWPGLQKSFIENRPPERELIDLYFPLEDKKLRKLEKEGPHTAEEIADYFLQYAKQIVRRQDRLFGDNDKNRSKMSKMQKALVRYEKSVLSLFEADFNAGRLNGQTFENLVLFLYTEPSGVFHRNRFWDHLEWKDMQAVYFLFKALCTVPGDSPLDNKLKTVKDAVRVIAGRSRLKAVSENWFNFVNRLSSDPKRMRKLMPKSHFMLSVRAKMSNSAFALQSYVYESLRQIEEILYIHSQQWDIEIGRSSDPVLLSKIPKQEHKYGRSAADEVILGLKKKYPKYLRLIDLFAMGGEMKWYTPSYCKIGIDLLDKKEFGELLERVILPLEMEAKFREKSDSVRATKAFGLVKSVWPMLQKSFVENRPPDKKLLEALGIKIEVRRGPRQLRRCAQKLLKRREHSPAEIAEGFKKFAFALAKRQQRVFVKSPDLRAAQCMKNASLNHIGRYLREDFRNGGINGQTFENLVLFTSTGNDLYNVIDAEDKLCFWAGMTRPDVRVVYNLFKELCSVPGGSPLGNNIKDIKELTSLIAGRSRVLAIRETIYGLLSQRDENRGECLMKMAKERMLIEDKDGYYRQIEIYGALQKIDRTLVTFSQLSGMKVVRKSSPPEYADDKEMVIFDDYKKVTEKLHKQYPGHKKLVNLFFEKIKKGGGISELSENALDEDVDWAALIGKILIPPETVK